MKYEDYSQVKNYLIRFDQILDQMATKMLSTQNITNNITLNFIICMIPHHQAAIYMCQNLLQYTTFEPLQNIAQGIIQTQTKGIQQMREIAQTTSGYESSLLDIKTYMQRYLEITNHMLNRMKNSQRIMDINLDFVSEMIPHHEGAIAMCHNLLKYRIDPRLATVANSIIQEQSRGVMELKEIRKELWGYWNTN